MYFHVFSTFQRICPEKYPLAEVQMRRFPLRTGTEQAGRRSIVRAHMHIP